MVKTLPKFQYCFLPFSLSQYYCRRMRSFGSSNIFWNICRWFCTIVPLSLFVLVSENCVISSLLLVHTNENGFFFCWFFRLYLQISEPPLHDSVVPMNAAATMSRQKSVCWTPNMLSILLFEFIFRLLFTIMIDASIEMQEMWSISTENHPHYYFIGRICQIHWLLSLSLQNELRTRCFKINIALIRFPLNFRW